MEGLSILRIVTSLAVLLFSVSLHESAHAWMAERKGDPTGRLLGRITLNPIRHMDLVGSFIVPMIGIFTSAPVFAWAKPVPVNPGNLRDFRKDQLFIALAGPVSNLLAAVSFLALYKLLTISGLLLHLLPEIVVIAMLMLCQVGVLLNIILAVFNLIPIPPLDGSWVLLGVLPPRMAFYFDKIRPYGFGILLLLLLTGGLGYILNPILDSVMFLIR